MLRPELGLRILSLVIALALTVVVRGERRVNQTFSVPLETRLPPGLEPASPLPTSLRVAVAGPWARLRSLAPAELGPVTLDLSRTGPGVATWAVRPESVKLPAGVRVESLYPSQGTVQLRPDRQ